MTGLLNRPSNCLLFLKKHTCIYSNLLLSCAEKINKFINMHNKCHDVNELYTHFKVNILI